MPRPRRRAPPRRRSPAAVLRTAGEGGLVVELADVIDPAVNARVHRLARAVRERLAGRVTEVVPTHRSLLVRHDPLREPRRRLARDVLALLAAPPDGPEPARRSRTVNVPACYGGARGGSPAGTATHGVNRRPP